MTIKRHRVTYTELVVDDTASTAFLEFSTAAGNLAIPVKMPGNDARDLCKDYLILKVGKETTEVYMHDREASHGPAFWQEFIYLGDPPNELMRAKLIEDYMVGEGTY